MFNTNEFYHEYFAIVNSANSKDRKKLPRDDINYQYFESHHIIPRSCGGDDGA